MSKNTDATWKTALTVAQEVRPPFIPEHAEVMTVVIEYPPGDPGAPPHRHPSGRRRTATDHPCRRGVLGTGGDVIHYRQARHRSHRCSSAHG